MPHHCSALILAGGLSSRMHFPKAYLLYRNTTFARHLIQTYREAGIHRIYIVMNHRLCKKEWSPFLTPIKALATVIENHQPDWGRAYSLLLGLNNVMDTDYCFIQNVDNPFIDAPLIEKIFAKRNSGGIVAPSYLGKGGHPVLISKPVMREIIKSNREDLNIRDLLSKFPKTNVEVSSEEVLFNINTHEEYFQFIKYQTA